MLSDTKIQEYCQAEDDSNCDVESLRKRFCEPLAVIYFQTEAPATKKTGMPSYILYRRITKEFAQEDAAKP
ncbi:hypothetical protein [Thiocystis violacea]|uniref:hypothetical protein n=1 Tax=Thiocystis violacea TaxID=13725 RepID=UPI001904CCB0|nr:hypothetical protein [Thiocystis violacea]